MNEQDKNKTNQDESLKKLREIYLAQNLLHGTDWYLNVGYSQQSTRRQRQLY